MATNCVIDIECDGLNPTKIHCMSVGYRDSNNLWQVKSTTDYNEMRSVLDKADVIIGHNFMRFDIVVLEKLLEVKYEGKIIDTLALSWYLEPSRFEHGLEEWGVTFGIPKPKITDWDNLSVEEYIHRCEEDVKINTRLWKKQANQLMVLYDDKSEAWRFVDYLMFKMDCAREQESSRWKLDTKRCESGLQKLFLVHKEKIDNLFVAMPVVQKMGYKTPPAKAYKADGTLSSTGTKWVALCRENGFEDTYRGKIPYIKSIEDPNPSSSQQVKEWLFTLGWKPTTFKYEQRSAPKVMYKKNGEISTLGEKWIQKLKEQGKPADYRGEITDAIPQLKDAFSENLCSSVSKLIEVEPAIKHLQGLYVIEHRMGILKGFLRDVDEDGYIQAKVSGFTNTLRFIHKQLVNLPSASAPYAEDIRASLIAPDGYELCGSDMSSLEDRTKQHYMWSHDPAYVKEMQTPDFDPHLALAEFAGALSPEQVKAHKSKEEDFSKIRHLYKTANYSCTYGAGAKKLGLTLDIPTKEARGIVKAYRDKNWSIDSIAKKVTTKTCIGSKWLYNSVSGFWYSLRHEKDKFSTLNQGTGVYAFDRWVQEVRRKRPQLTGQFHDEIILCIKKGHREGCEKLLKEAVITVNEELNLNRDLDVDVQYGTNYAEIH